MYTAYRRGVPVVTISPLAENWVVRALSRRVYPNVASFAAAVQAAASPAEGARLAAWLAAGQRIILARPVVP